MALKLARYATGRHKTLSAWDSFHGANLDTIGIGGEALFRRRPRAVDAGRRASPAARSGGALLRRGQAFRALCRLHRLCFGGSGRRVRPDCGANALDDRRSAAGRFLATGAGILPSPRRVADLRRDSELSRADRHALRMRADSARRRIFSSSARASAAESCLSRPFCAETGSTARRKRRSATTPTRRAPSLPLRRWRRSTSSTRKS